MYPTLIAHIRKFTDLSDEEAEVVCSYFEHQQVAKKGYLLKPGQVCKHNHFIVKGVMRLYFINHKDVEHITQFGIENWWIADLDSFVNQKPSKYYIQAIEASEVLLLSKDAEVELFKQVPQLESYFRRVLQRAFIATQRRVEFIFNMTEEEQYRYFAATQPEFIQRVPQYMLAAYLGFTPQFLSRIRAKRK